MSKRIRCAIYTRKSTKEGLEQDFNSLDAQREACDAFIQSQRGLGWRALKKHYDDGGLSGGTIDRPALQSLLTDIDKGKVDLVVVYKVDRLTRSLMDFAKIIETFDARGISFVSVTQQFNTANSMGRLTLNVLLSFAQFEREVTAERIRDKIAASKKKGMWMGGPSPLGYNVEDRKLVIAKAEATTVRKLFDLYIKLGTVRKLKEEANRLGITTKHRVQKNGKKTGGKPFSRGNLYQFLSNPLYIGKVPHKGETYPGQHKAIIDQATWNTVQRILVGNAVDRSCPTNTRAGFLLTGLSFDETGDRLTPTYANKKGQRYRYYISKRLVGSADKEGRGWRLPAEDLEKTVIFSVAAFLSDEAEWMKAVDLTGQSPEVINRLRKHMEELATRLEISDASSRKQALEEVLESVTVKPGMISIILRRDGLNPCGKVGGGDAGYELNVPFHTKRRGVESKIILGGRNPQPILLDRKLIDVIRRSFEWLRLLTEEPEWSIDRLAKHTSMDASDVTRFLPLAYLAPDIVEAILNGRQPIELNVERLKKIGPIPADWSAQRHLLGFKNPSELGSA